MFPYALGGVDRGPPKVGRPVGRPTVSGPFALFVVVKRAVDRSGRTAIEPCLVTGASVPDRGRAYDDIYSNVQKRWGHAIRAQGPMTRWYGAAHARADVVSRYNDVNVSRHTRLNRPEGR